MIECPLCGQGANGPYNPHQKFLQSCAGGDRSRDMGVPTAVGTEEGACPACASRKAPWAGAGPALSSRQGRKPAQRDRGHCSPSLLSPHVQGQQLSDALRPPLPVVLPLFSLMSPSSLLFSVVEHPSQLSHKIISMKFSHQEWTENLLRSSRPTSRPVKVSCSPWGRKTPLCTGSTSETATCEERGQPSQFAYVVISFVPF